MIQPVKRDAALIAEIDETVAERPVLWWLGQSGFAIKHRDSVYYLDPYLSESLTAKYRDTSRPHIRMTERPLDPAAIRHARCVLATHKHSDHLDPGTLPVLLQASPAARLVLPRSLAGHAEAMGAPRERIVPANAGDVIPAGPGVTIHVVPSAHENLDWSEETGYPYLGYVLDFDGCVIYHPGDCSPFEGLCKWLAPHRPDVALLPINGRDPARGVPGNFTIVEAAALAHEIGARWVVPTHYDMFTFNTVDVATFLDHARRNYPSLGVKALRCGELWQPPPERS